MLPTVGRRNLNTKSMFEYGEPCRLLARPPALHGARLPLTVYGVGQALERNPEAARAMVEPGWAVASHGWRWIDYMDMPEEEEQGAQVPSTRSRRSRRRGGSARSAGTRAGISDNTRRLVVEEGSFLYDSDWYRRRACPYWVEGRRAASR